MDDVRPAHTFDEIAGVAGDVFWKTDFASTYAIIALVLLQGAGRPHLRFVEFHGGPIVEWWLSAEKLVEQDTKLPPVDRKTVSLEPWLARSLEEPK